MVARKNNSEAVAVLETKVDIIQVEISSLNKKFDHYINIYTAHPVKCRGEFDRVYATKEEVHSLREHIDSQLTAITKILDRQESLIEKYGWRIATIAGIIGISTKQVGLW